MPAAAALRFIGRVNRGVDYLARVMNRCAGWLFVLCAFFITFDVLAPSELEGVYALSWASNIWADALV